MNKVFIIGHLVNDPETRATPSGVSVTQFTIAVNRRFPGSDGNKVTDFFRIQAWRGLADTCAKYLNKGKKVAVLGELQARLYEAKDGKTRMSLDVSADEVEFLSSKDDKPAQKPADPNTFQDISSNDLPF